VHTLISEHGYLLALPRHLWPPHVLAKQRMPSMVALTLSDTGGPYLATWTHIAETKSQLNHETRKEESNPSPHRIISETKPTSLIGGMPQDNTPRSRCTRGWRLRRCWCHGWFWKHRNDCVLEGVQPSTRDLCAKIKEEAKNMGYCRRKRAKRCLANILGCWLHSPIRNKFCVNILGGV
jgi:hypothetical protein